MNKKKIATWGVRLGSVALVTAVAGSIAARSPSGDVAQKAPATAGAGDVFLGENAAPPDGQQAVLPDQNYGSEWYEEDRHEEGEHLKDRYKREKHDDEHEGLSVFFQDGVKQIKPNTRTRAS